jgi:hypothetical protein
MINNMLSMKWDTRKLRMLKRKETEEDTGNKQKWNELNIIK